MAKRSDDHSAEETQRRTEKALRAAFNSPHKTYEESKVGKLKPPARKNPRKRKGVEKSR